MNSLRLSIPRVRRAGTVVALSAMLFPAALTAAVIGLSVPGTSDIWLAGQANGTSLGGDSAPTHSPAQVAINLSGVTSLTFSATGTTSNTPNIANGSGPDGGSSFAQPTPNFGISGISSNLKALLGVFLTDAVPGGVAPVALNFTTGGLTRDFTSLSPLLSQVFFIGDGQTSGALVQQFNVPAGATRLFLGTLDADGGSYDNSGAFSVNVTYAPAGVPDGASTAGLLGLSVLALAFFSRRLSPA